jgi:hypothetical protein
VGQGKAECRSLTVDSAKGAQRGRGLTGHRWTAGLLQVTPGYICSNVDDLLVAYRLLGSAAAVVKPLQSKEGGGMLFVTRWGHGG